LAAKPPSRLRSITRGGASKPRPNNRLPARLASSLRMDERFPDPTMVNEDQVSTMAEI
jgi:hypothetical protein